MYYSVFAGSLGGQSAIDQFGQRCLNFGCPPCDLLLQQPPLHNAFKRILRFRMSHQIVKNIESDLRRGGPGRTLFHMPFLRCSSALRQISRCEVSCCFFERPLLSEAGYYCPGWMRRKPKASVCNESHLDKLVQATVIKVSYSQYQLIEP